MAAAALESEVKIQHFLHFFPGARSLKIFFKTSFQLLLVGLMWPACSPAHTKKNLRAFFINKRERERNYGSLMSFEKIDTEAEKNF